MFDHFICIVTKPPLYSAISLIHLLRRLRLAFRLAPAGPASKRSAQILDDGVQQLPAGAAAVAASPDNSLEL